MAMVILSPLKDWVVGPLSKWPWNGGLWSTHSLGCFSECPLVNWHGRLEKIHQFWWNFHGCVTALKFNSSPLKSYLPQFRSLPTTSGGYVYWRPKIWMVRTRLLSLLIHGNLRATMPRFPPGKAKGIIPRRMMVSTRFRWLMVSIGDVSTFVDFLCWEFEISRICWSVFFPW